MARSGYRIFDADTHIIEAAEPIEAYLSAADKSRLAALGPLVGRAQGKGGMSRYRVGKRPDLNRMLGSRDRVPPADAVARGLKDGGTPWDVRWQGPPFPDDRVNFDSHARVKDMDIEGVDVNMVLPSGGLAAFSGLDDAAVELSMYQAYHRFLKDYCAPYPDRLTSVLHVTVRDVAGSVAEIRRCGKERWPVGIFPVCPPGRTLDDPDWDPIWAAAQEHDLTVVIHSFTMSVPYPPGMWDNWDNMFLVRSASHVWNAQRNMAALIGSGVLDRHPEPAPDLARVRARVARVLGLAPRRAGRDEPARAAAAQEEAERVHPRAAVLPEHPAARGRAVPAPGYRGHRRGHLDVRDGLSALRELVPQVGGRRAQVDVDPRGRPAQAPLGERGALLPALQRLHVGGRRARERGSAVTGVARLELTLACGDYDRTRAIRTGEVKPDGVELNVVTLAPEEMFYRMARFREFDVSELSLSTYTVLRGRGEPLVAVPVFPSFSFRHSSVFVGRTPGSRSRAIWSASAWACPSTT